MKYYTLTSNSTLTITINDHDYTYTYADLDTTREIPYRFNIGSAAVDSEVPVNVYTRMHSRWDSEGHSSTSSVISVYNANGNLITTTSRHSLTKDYRGVATLQEAINLQCIDDPPTFSGSIGVSGHTELSECPKSTVLTNSRSSGGCGIQLIKEYDSTKVVNYEDIKVKVIFHGQGVVPDYSKLVAQGSTVYHTPSNIPSNYTFKNWSKDPNATAGLRSWPVTEFTELYAIWEVNDNQAFYREFGATTGTGTNINPPVPNFMITLDISPEWKKYITTESVVVNLGNYIYNVYRVYGLPANCKESVTQNHGPIIYTTVDNRHILTAFDPVAPGYTYSTDDIQFVTITNT